MNGFTNFRYAARTLWGGALLAGLLLSGGCSQDDDFVPDDGSGAAVHFTAEIAQATPANAVATMPRTRTANDGDRWTMGDPVGIFMLETDAAMPDGIIAGADNVKYTVTDTATGAMAPDGGTPLYYPQWCNVDFVAYYPYGATSAGSITAGTVNGTNGTYHISVAGQSDEAAQNARDVLYAKAENVAKSKTAVKLAFGHVLSKITLNIKAGEGIAQADVRNLAGSSVAFEGMPQTATLDLQYGRLTAGAAGTFNPVKASAAAAYDATFTALVIPQAANAYTGRTMVFTVAGEIYTWTIPDTDAFVEGNHYIYPLTIRKTGIDAGTPTIADWQTNDHGTGTAVALFVKIPAGTFLMGSPADEPNREANETRHSVTLTEDFHMSKYPVMNGQYAAFLNAAGIGENGMGTVSYTDGSGNPQTDQSEPFIYDSSTCSQGNYNWGLTWDATNSKWVPVSGYGDYPVIFVTWYGAKAFADYYGYRLPTEAQWEYACRGGQTESSPFGIEDGNKLTAGMANFYIQDSYGPGGSFFDSENHSTYYKGSTTAVGNYPYANGYGLYDMHGNVREWCADWYDSNYYSTSPDTDPAGPDTGSNRVLRGGAWNGGAQTCRSASRYSAKPEYFFSFAGFRVVFVP